MFCVYTCTRNWPTTGTCIAIWYVKQSTNNLCADTQWFGNELPDSGVLGARSANLSVTLRRHTLNKKGGFEIGSVRVFANSYRAHTLPTGRYRF